MELQIIMPDQAGQICKMIGPLDDVGSNEVYIVSEDPQLYDENETIYVVALKELQRNISNPELASQTSVTKNELTVVAQDLDAYIKSWNNS